MLRSEAVIVCSEVQNVLAALRQSRLGYLDDGSASVASTAGDSDLTVTNQSHGLNKSKSFKRNHRKTSTSTGDIQMEPYEHINANESKHSKTHVNVQDGNEMVQVANSRSSSKQSINDGVQFSNKSAVRPGLGSYASHMNGSTQLSSTFNQVDVITKRLDVLRERLHLFTYSNLNSSTSKSKRSSIDLTPKDIYMPFLEAIKEGTVGAAPTSIALAAVHRMIRLEILVGEQVQDNELCVNDNENLTPPSEKEKNDTVGILPEIVDSVIHCHFEQTDTGADEIAIMWILELLKESVFCRHGKRLKDQKIWEIVSTLYQISVGKSNADMLRGMATRILGEILDSLFHRLFLGVEEEPGEYAYGHPVAIKIFHFLCTKIDPNKDSWHDMESRSNCLELIMIVIQSTIDFERGTIELTKSDRLIKLIEDDLFRCLVQTCQTAGRGFVIPETPSSSRPNTPTKFESDPVNIGSPDLASYGVLSRTPLVILTAALRVAFVLMSHHNTRAFLKVQIECFFNSVFLRVLEGKSGSVNEARIVLETLADLMADTTLVTDLFVNFDCDLKSSDVFVNLFEQLSRYTFPMRMRAPALNNLQLLSLRCILYGVKAMADRCVSDGPSSNKVEVILSKYHRTPEELVKLRAAKRALKYCAEQFNKKPKRGIAALQSAGILAETPDPATIATFLRDTNGLDKVAIGQFLGSDEPLNKLVLKEFVNTFQMKDQTLLQALRMFLESFRLPGEAQQIDRILQCFAEIAYRDCDEAKTMPSCDCTYLFSFSIIMLNTDLHNPNIRPEKKMSMESFIKLNTNYGEEASGGKDLSVDFLKSVYKEIKEREINTMMEGSALTAEITTDRWRDIISKQRNAITYEEAKKSDENNGIQPSLKRMVVTGSKEIARLYDEHMFSLCWAPATAAMSVVFDSGDVIEQPVALDAAQDGFLLCAQIASHFNMIDVFDAIAISLCKFTSLLLYAPSSMPPLQPRERVNRKKRKQNSKAKEKAEDDEMIDDTNGEENDEKMTDKDTNKLELKRSLELYSFSNLRAIASDRLGLPSSIIRTQQWLETATKAQLATIFVFAIAQKYGNFMRESWSHLTYCLLRLSDLDLVPSSLAVESNDDLVDNSLRLQYHENIRATLLKEAVERVRREREKSEYAAVGWLSNWLFGESSPGESALLSNKEDHYALLSCTRIADAAVGRKTQIRKTQIGEDQSVAKNLSNGELNSHNNSSSKRKEALECIKRCHLHGFVTDTAKLSESALISLVKALVVASGGKLVSVERLPSSQILKLSPSDEKGNAQQPNGNGSGSSDNKEIPINLTKESVVVYAQDDRSVDKLSPPSMASWLFGLHLITEVTLVNYLRMEKIWHLVEDRFLEVIEASKLSPNYHLETVSVGLLRIACINLCCEKVKIGMKLEMLNILQLLLATSEDVAPGLSLLVAVACKKLFVENKSQLLLTLKADDSEAWSKVTTLFILMADQVEDAAMVGFETVRHVLVEGSTRDVIPVRHALTILMAFTNRHGVENSKVAEEALGLVFSLHTRLEPSIRKIIDVDEEQPNDRSVIENDWIPLITEITGVVRNPHHPPSTQFSALNHLKKALLDVHGQALTGDEWGMIIEKVLFALCESVLNSSPDQDHDVEAEKTRAYGVMILVIDVVKQYKVALTKQLTPNRFESLWIQIIKYLERFKKIIPGDEVHKQLEELERMSTT